MTRKELVNALIEEMENFGEAFIGTTEVQGTKVTSLYKAINKEVTKRYEGKYVVAYDGRTGMAWIA